MRTSRFVASECGVNSFHANPRRCEPLSFASSSSSPRHLSDDRSTCMSANTSNTLGEGFDSMMPTESVSILLLLFSAVPVHPYPLYPYPNARLEEMPK